MHQAPVGLPEEEQPPGPRKQAVLHPRQEDGQGMLKLYRFVKYVFNS